MIYSPNNWAFLALFFLFFGPCAAEAPTLKTTQLSPTSYQLNIEVPAHSDDALYADYISFSVDHPEVQLSDWRSSIEPINKYDPQFKQTKSIFNQPFSITMNAELTDPALTDVNVHMITLQGAQQKNKHYKFPLAFSHEKKELVAPAASVEPPAQKDSSSSVQSQQSSAPSSIHERLTHLFSHTESWSLRLLLALLLGLILSLTPCIYPMIPITVGILQSQGSRSISRNFFISLAYISGIATTFALLGTTAAFTGKMFGSIMNNPVVIIGIVLLMAYLAGAMIGFYELYLPSFLQNNNRQLQGGSIVSTFLFGIVSGTVASPCLSPGLLLLLTMVTALGSIALGFTLLFFFGLGLGIPLLLIGTFSSSLNMLPKAGHWMIDIKQFFGFLMLATCFYFLANIVPAYLIAWAFALFCTSIGIFYCSSARKSHSTVSQVIKNVIGIILIACSVYLFFNAYKETDIRYQESEQHVWLYDYDQAVEQAKKTGQKILLDISAPYCSICKAIDKKIFAAPPVQEKIKHLLAVKIDDIEANETTLAVQKKFQVFGAPTIILYDPQEDKELHRWGGELYDWTADQFAEKLQ